MGILDIRLDGSSSEMDAKEEAVVWALKAMSSQLIMLSFVDSCLVETYLFCRLSRFLNEFCKGDESGPCIVWKANALRTRTRIKQMKLALRKLRLLPLLLPRFEILSEHIVILVVLVFLSSRF